jgi:hypothetical protein
MAMKKTRVLKTEELGKCLLCVARKPYVGNKTDFQVFSGPKRISRVTRSLIFKM